MGHEVPYEGIRSPSEAQLKRIARRQVDERGPGRKSLVPTILAGTFMAALGGYALVKHYPQARLHVLGRRLATILENPRSIGIPAELADAITGHLGKLSSRVAGALEQASSKQHIADIVDSSAFTAPEVTNALRLLHDSLAKHPESFSTVGDIISTVGSQFKRTHQKSILSLRRLKVGDLYDEAGQWRSALGREPKKLGETKGLIKGLFEELPSMKSTIADLPVDSGLFFYQDKVLDLRQWTPTSWMSTLDKAADAGGVGARMGRWLLGMMAPTGLLTPRGGIAVVGGSSVRPHMEGASKFAQQHLQGGLFMQGKLFPVMRGGAIGDVVHKSAVLARKRSQIGGMIGKTAARQKPIDEFIEEHAKSFAKLGRFEGAAKTAVTWADKIGVRPQVQPDMGEPILQSMYKFIQRPVATTQEGAWKAYKFIKGTRPKPPDPTTSMFRQSGLAATGRLKAADHFFNYQLSRVGYLLESTVGLGIKPGKSSAGTIARWLAVGGAAWAGTKYAGYVNHLARDAVGIGPIDLPIHGYMAARQGLQGTIELMGARKKFGAPGAVVAGVAALAAGTDLTMSSAKLGRIYRGEEDVEVRKGRWWALGCLVGEQDVLLADGRIKQAKDVLPGDVLLNDKGEETEVLATQARKTTAEEDLVSIGVVGYPGKTKVTGNHEIFVHRKHCPYKGQNKYACHPKKAKNILCQSHIQGEHTKCVYSAALNLQYIRADELCVGDCVVVPRRAVTNIIKTIDLRLLDLPYIQHHDGTIQVSQISPFSAHKTTVFLDQISEAILDWGEQPQKGDKIRLFRQLRDEHGYTGTYGGIQHRIDVQQHRKDSGDPNWHKPKLIGIQAAPRTDSFDPIITPTLELGELLGWLIAEGSSHNVGSSVEAVYNLRELSWAERMAEVARKTFGCRCKQSIKHKDTTGIVVISGGFFEQFVRDLGIIPDKQIDVRCFLNWGEDFVRGLIRGCFYGDGCRTTAGRIWTYKSKNLYTVVGLRDLITAIGGTARIEQSSSVFNGKRFTAYVLAITEPPEIVLEKHYISEAPRKDIKHFSAIGFENVVLYPIKLIELDKPPEVVYDFWVDEGESFCLPGHVVHNSTPFSGGAVEEYRRPHLLALALTDYKKESIHGSAANYYKEGTYLPTPSNWFGARKLLFPYETELRTAHTRPYPISGTAGESIPIIGPAFAATIGRLIKPRKKLHSDYFYKDTLLEPGKFTAMRGEFGTSGLTQQQRRPSAVSNLRLDQAVGKQIDILRDFTGLPGFLLGAIKGKITGDADFFSSKRQIATSADMDSYERGYYDLRMGGISGLTELLRRFIPRRRKQIEQVNPIVNSAMSFLPGSFSAFPEDRQYHIDFHRGSPWNKIPHGEARLPGIGYEQTHRLHSGIPGVYDAFDRYKILASVAPSTEAFKHYEAIVMGQIRTSSLAEESEGKGIEGLLGSDIRGIVARVIDGDTMEVSIDGRLTTVRMAGVNTPESTSTRRRENTAEGLLATRYTREQFEGQEVSLTPWGLDPHGRLLAKVDRSYQIAGKGPGQILREEYPAQSMLKQDRAEFNRIQDTVRDRFEPHKFHEKIFSNPFSVVARNQRKLQTMTLGKKNEHTVAQGQYTLPEKLTGWAYENVAHFEPPGPMGWVKNKFFPIRSAEEHYKRFRVTGKAYAPWETPVDSFIKPWMWGAVDAVTPGPTVVPPQVKKRWEVESYFDRLKYAKSKILSNQARDIGALSQAQYWSRQSKKTATYALAAGNANFARAGLPRLDRPYYNAFVRTADEAERDQIRNIVSPDMRGLLELSWSGVRPQKVDPDVEAAAYLSTGRGGGVLVDRGIPREVVGGLEAGGRPGPGEAQGVSG
jgi:hypothetical protein